MATAIAFIAGIIVCLIAMPVFRFIQRRVLSSRQSSSIEANQVTTVSQVLHLAIQGAPTGVTVVDQSGDVILSNPAAHEMTIVHDRSINPELWRVAEKVFDDKEERIIDHSISKRRTGNRVLQIRALVKPLTLIDDRFVIIFATDESEYARMESARRDFVANVSHELKTPVGGIALLAEALLDSPEDPEHVEYFGSRVQKEAYRMADMVNELIALSKLQGAEALPELEPVSVDAIVNEAIIRNQLTAESHEIQITRGMSVDALVEGDKALLVTAISNLISNAVHYSPEAMPVSISQKRINDDIVAIRVTDRGIGIAPEDQARVFERFFRVDKARSRQTGGTGLGLAIVKHVVANHGGNIKLWSRLGTGSTFTIELPIYHEPKPEKIPAATDNEHEKSPKADLHSAVARAASRRKDKTS
ncbi:sensor histidine kinase [Corynebacterium casei]|uniref:sensor histidine kinase n=1 Tax=Corynebacterium casei TaxID=160386 RepID=UPI001867DD33|nr:ATP-binding protein [Corynebacterium casei]